MHRRRGTGCGLHSRTGRADGNWCDGDRLVTCEGGENAGSTLCQVACAGDGPNAACIGYSFCEGKADGYWCNDETGDLTLCKDGLISGTLDCEGAGCLHMDDGVDDECDEGGVEVPPEFCDDKPDTSLCDGDNLVHCDDGEPASVEQCPFGCVANWPESPDECGSADVDPQFCIGKAGYYCSGAALVYCSNNVVAAVEECPTGCSAQDQGTPDLCDYQDPAAFCASYGDGAWCNGPDELIVCAGGAVAGSSPCPVGCIKNPPGSPDACAQPAGCQAGLSGAPLSVVVDENCCPSFVGSTWLSGVPVFDQTAYEDQLGTCEGETIHSWGCLITSFTMVYEYAGVYRTVDGVAKANSPSNENEWRTDGNQGYACCEGECGDGKGICCAYWNTNPPGYGGVTKVDNNNEDGCFLSVPAANAIAAEMNAGSPLLAWVQSSYTTQHWVVVVGVDANGTLLLNDPWHGVKGSKISGSNGLGPYNNLVMLFTRGGIGRGGADVEGRGEPEPPEQAGNVEGGPIGVTSLTEEGEQEFGGFIVDDGKGGGSGCGAVIGARASPWRLVGAFVLIFVLSLFLLTGAGSRRGEEG